MAINSIRFTGLASGLDTESIVESMVAVQKAKVDTSKQAKLLLELQKDKEKELSSRVKEFMLNYSAKLRFSSGFAKLNTSSTNPAVNVASGTVSGEFEIENISIAKNAKLSTESLGKSGVTTLGDLGITFKEGEDTVIRISDGVDEKGKEIVTDVKVTSSTTLSDLAKKLKDVAPNSNITYDENAKGFFISGKNTGSNSFINLEAVKIAKSEDGSVVETVDSSITDKLGIKTTSDKGKDATFTFEGMKITSASNNVTVNGLSLELKDDVTGSVKLNATQDKDAIFNTVKELITEYNKLLTDLNAMVEASPNKSYKPLLDEQKAEMSESEITAWNKKIEDSLFAGNDTIRKVVSSLKDSMSGSFGGITLRDLGIESNSWQDKGVLTVTDDKLRSMVNDNPEKVIELFAGDGKLDGIADKMYSDLTNKFKAVNGIKSSTSLFNDIIKTKNITDEAKKADKLEERRKALEDMYYKKFTAMEKMLSQLNSQSSWLSNLGSSQ